MEPLIKPQKKPERLMLNALQKPFTHPTVIKGSQSTGYDL